MISHTASYAIYPTKLVLWQKLDLELQMYIVELLFALTHIATSLSYGFATDDEVWHWLVIRIDDDDNADDGNGALSAAEEEDAPVFVTGEVVCERPDRPRNRD